MNPRQGPLARISRYRETTWGTDPTTPNAFLIPFLTDGFDLRQPRTAGNFYDGVMSAKGSYLEAISCQGEINTSLDYWAIGYDLMDALGSTGYARVGGFHRWVGMGNPLPHGIRKEFLQSPAIVHRYPAVVATQMRFAQAGRGQQQYGVTRLGSGAEQLTDIAGTVLVDSTEKVTHTYYNGVLYQDGTALTNPAAFDLTIDRKVSGKEGLFSAGALSAYSVGVPEVRGTLGKIFTTDDGDTFYLAAKNETESSIICIYANKPIAAGPTKFVRIILPSVLFDRMATAAGGDTIPDQSQTFYAQIPASTKYYPGHAVGTAIGPYNLSGSDNVFSSKPDGGTKVDVTLPTGSAVTTDAVVAALNADGGFSAKFVATNLMGRVEYASKDTTSSSSVQWQTGTTNSAHTKLGFDSTTWSGYAPKEIYVELMNPDNTTDYT